MVEKTGKPEVPTTFESPDAEREKLIWFCDEKGHESLLTADKAVKITMRYSEFKICNLLLRWPSADPYPEFPVTVEFKSTTVADKLVNLLTKRVETHLQGLAKEGKATGLAAYLYLDNILQNNNLIPAWSEFALLKEVINAEKGDTLKTMEKAGKIVVTLCEGKFKLVAEFTVPSSYPMQQVKLVFKEHNFN